MAKIPKLAPCGRVDFHALRVSFISAVIESGATVKEAMAAARHSTPNLTMNTYARTREGRLAEIAEHIGAGILTGETDSQSPMAAQFRATGTEDACAASAYGEQEVGSIPPASTTLPGSEVVGR